MILFTTTMGNRFGISGLGSEPVRGRRDDNERDSESYRPTEEPRTVPDTYSTGLSSPSRPEQENRIAVMKEVK